MNGALCIGISPCDPVINLTQELPLAIRGKYIHHDTMTSKPETSKPASPVRPTDDEARDIARKLITSARVASLAFLDPKTGTPLATRVGFGLGTNNTWLTLISELSGHTRALRTDNRVGLLLGEAPTKGDPLAFPRLSVRATCDFINRTDPSHAVHREAWLSHHPKAKLYIDFADFSFVRFTPLAADLNGGFGKAYALGTEDLNL